MGQDGAKGIGHIRDLGGYTIAQEPATAPIRMYASGSNRYREGFRDLTSG